MATHLSSEFWVQVSCPKWAVKFDPDDSTVDEALETIFSLETESAIVFWGGAPIALSYKYDISCICMDVVRLLAAMLDSDVGSRLVDWPSSNFSATWAVRWEGGVATVEATWRSLTGGVEEVLRSAPPVTMPVAEVLAELGGIVSVARVALESAGYTSAQIPELLQLRSTEARLVRPGRLYRSTQR